MQKSNEDNRVFNLYPFKSSRISDFAHKLVLPPFANGPGQTYVFKSLHNNVVKDFSFLLHHLNENFSHKFLGTFIGYCFVHHVLPSEVRQLIIIGFDKSLFKRAKKARTKVPAKTFQIATAKNLTFCNFDLLLIILELEDATWQGYVLAKIVE